VALVVLGHSQTLSGLHRHLRYTTIEGRSNGFYLQELRSTETGMYHGYADHGCEEVDEEEEGDGTKWRSNVW